MVAGGINFTKKNDKHVVSVASKMAKSQTVQTEQ